MTSKSTITSAYDLHHLVYVSQRVIGVNQISESEVVDQILQPSIRNNSKLNVTGALLLCDNWFVQTLEGRRIDVDMIFERISRNINHKHIKKLFAGPIAKRNFPIWSMCASILAPTDRAIIDVLETSGKFDGNKLDGSAAMRLLLAVGRLQAVHEPHKADEYVAAGS
jgi:hypothetical protein